MYMSLLTELEIIYLLLSYKYVAPLALRLCINALDKNIAASTMKGSML